MTKTIVAIVALGLSLTACGSATEDSPDNSTPGHIKTYNEYGDDQSVKVVDIGDKICYLYDGYQSGGIWCEPSK